jgi:hypothetical protein
MISLFILASFQNSVLAGTPEQQELDQVMEMMKQQGMDPQQMQQMENMFKSMSQMETRKKNARIENEQQAFEAETAGYGTALSTSDASRAPEFMDLSAPPEAYVTCRDD